MRTICLFLFIALASRMQAQTSREEFVNEVFPQMMDSTRPGYYLLAGTDTCRFEKYDYDEWVKYHLKEPVPLTTLNELAYKVHVARTPYYWQQDKLKNALCVTAGKADSLIVHAPGSQVFSLSQPQFTDDGEYAVFDINWKRDLIRGAGYTFLFRRTSHGWKRIGFKQNWGGDL